MDAELDRLEQQFEELVRLFEALKQDNRALSSRVAALEADNARLATKVETAVRGVSAVLETLPGN